MMASFLEADVGHAHQVGDLAHAAGQFGEGVEADGLVGEFLAGELAAHPAAGDLHAGLAGGHQLLGIAIGFTQGSLAEVALLDPFLELGGRLDEGVRSKT